MSSSLINPREIFPALPDPLEASDPDLQDSLNRIAVQQCCRPRHGIKRKRQSGGNHTYHASTKATIAQDAKAFGSATQAAAKWSAILGHKINESTVRNWVIKYDDKVRRAGSDAEIVEIPDEKKGRPTKVPVAEDTLIQKHIKSLSETGGHISRAVVVAYGKVILDKRRPELSRRIKLGRSWAESLLKRMELVQCEVTKAARRSPVNLAETTNTFHEQIRKLVCRGTIPKRLIINIDQTGVLMVPSQNITMAPRGAK